MHAKWKGIPHLKISQVMKFTNPLSLLAALGAIKAVSAANSFAGSNLYYAAGLNSSQTSTLVE